jgi:hypothetical protein
MRTWRHHEHGQTGVIVESTCRKQLTQHEPTGVFDDLVTAKQASALLSEQLPRESLEGAHLRREPHPRLSIGGRSHLDMFPGEQPVADRDDHAGADASRHSDGVLARRPQTADDLSKEIPAVAKADVGQ